MTVPSIHDQTQAGRRLVVRADLNVPLNDGAISDATRIERFAEGLKPLLDQGASAVVLSHLGRPKGQVKPEFSLRPVVPALSAALGRPVAFAESPSGAQTEAAAAALGAGEVLLCENLRFDPREEANDPALAAELARLGDLYVNDAFSCAHRAHASTAAIAECLPAVAGPLMLAEIEALTRALEAPKRPAVAIVGGAKVSSKIDVLTNLVGKLDAIIVGGGMANTFLFADGIPIGRSLCEKDQVGTVETIRARAGESGCDLELPVDIVHAPDFKEHAPATVAALDACPEEAMILDVGPASIERFREILGRARTILWNGPLGAFEIEPFDRGTLALAKEAAGLTRAGSAVSVAGGGDTVAALNKAGVTQDFTYVSTAGGAFLEWLEGKELPGIAALQSNRMQSTGRKA